MVLEVGLLLYWAGIPKHNFDHHCGDSESLLDGRAHGDDCGLRSLPLQRSVPNAAPAGGLATVGLEA